MSKKKAYAVLIGLCLVSILSMIYFGFIRGFNDNTEIIASSDDKLIMVGVSQLGSESVWRTANTESVQNTFTRDNGYFLVFSNARQIQENQVKALRGFISQKVDYIVFSPVTETGWDTVLMEAKDANIPVILMDRTVDVTDDSLYITRVGSDMHEEGKQAGMWLEEELRNAGQFNDDINIVILTGNKGSSAEIGRSGGFHEIADKHDNWNIIAEVDADFTTSKANEEMRKIAIKNSKIDVVVCQNDDMAFGAIEALESAGFKVGVGGSVKLISFDACKDALKMVEQGIINVDIECNPLQGNYISEVIKDIEAGEDVKKEYIVDEMVFTIDNVSEYIAERTY